MKYLPALIVTTCLYFIVPIDAQRSCCTHCKGQQLGLSAPQAKRLQGPRGKQGPIGHPGVQGEKGEDGAFYSDAKALAMLTTKYENLLSLTMELKSQLHYTANKCSVSAVGIANSAIIEDWQLSSSSSFSDNFVPRYGRLHSTTKQGWLMSSPYRVGQWLQVDLKNNRKIIGVATQGETGNNCCHVYNYKILYKEEGQQHFDTIRDDEGNEKQFYGNYWDDYANQVKKNNFDEPITARWVRISPIYWRTYPYLRWELLVC